VVTADGSILTASKEENPELFWAIRGSGSNFGVVPEIVMKLHPQRATVFAGVLVYPPSLVPQVAAAVDAWWTAGPSEKEVVYQIITLSPEGQVSVGYHRLFLAQ
jgi:FAD/FMN-containing dehydrogenase